MQNNAALLAGACQRPRWQHKGVTTLMAPTTPVRPPRRLLAGGSPSSHGLAETRAERNALFGVGGMATTIEAEPRSLARRTRADRPVVGAATPALVELRKLARAGADDVPADAREVVKRRQRLDRADQRAVLVRTVRLRPGRDRHLVSGSTRVNSDEALRPRDCVRSGWGDASLSLRGTTSRPRRYRRAGSGRSCRRSSPWR